MQARTSRGTNRFCFQTLPATSWDSDQLCVASTRPFSDSALYLLEVCRARDRTPLSGVTEHRVGAAGGSCHREESVLLPCHTRERCQQVGHPPKSAWTLCSGWPPGLGRPVVKCSPCVPLCDWMGPAVPSGVSLEVLLTLPLGCPWRARVSRGAMGLEDAYEEIPFSEPSFCFFSYAWGQDGLHARRAGPAGPHRALW